MVVNRKTVSAKKTATSSTTTTTMTTATSTAKKKKKRAALYKANSYVRIRPRATEGGHAGGATVAASAKQLRGWDDASVLVGWRGSHDSLGRELRDPQRYDFPRKVIPPEASQQEMYDTIMTDLVDTILAPPGKAQDALVFAYGQTGTGKTHTMLGPDASLSRAAPANGCIDEDWGCFPRAVYNVWNRLKSSEQPFVLSISAAEFYLMTGGDLLADNKPIVASLQTGEPLGLKQVILQEPSQVLDVLAVIRKNRHTRSTKMNQSKGDHQGSSRGHASILLRVSRIDTESGVLIETALNLIDLAGAERPSKIGVKRMSGYDAMIEIMNNPDNVSTDAQASLINFELHLLGTEVVTATQAHKTGSKPYKPQGLLNSVGMCALGSSLTGRAKIAIVVTLSQAEDCGWETWFSCQFGTNLSKLMTPRLIRQPSSARVVVKGSIETLVDLRKNLAMKTVGDKYRFKRECTAQHELERLLVLRELLNTILPKEDLEKLFAPLQAPEQNEEGKT